MDNNLWQEARDKYLNTTDNLGKTIDIKILDTVIALNLLGISTSQSCEGHLDRALAGPWIILGVNPSTDTNMLLEQKSQAFNEAQQIKINKPNEYIHDSVFIQKMDQYRKFQSQSLIPTLNNVNNLMSLLDEYYQNKTVPFSKRLIISEEDSLIPRLRNQGLYLQDICTPNDRKVNLLAFQNEMSSFTNFLKQKLQSTL